MLSPPTRPGRQIRPRTAKARQFGCGLNIDASLASPVSNMDPILSTPTGLQSQQPTTDLVLNSPTGQISKGRRSRYPKTPASALSKTPTSAVSKTPSSLKKPKDKDDGGIQMLIDFVWNEFD